MKRLAFSDDMMRALAAGEKTMTRRPVKPRPVGPVFPVDFSSLGIRPRHRVGDLVAATCAFFKLIHPSASEEEISTAFYRFGANGEAAKLQYNHARIMPAALAPFVLRITEVRAERLGDITDADAVREGMMHWARATWPSDSLECVRPVGVFAEYWGQLYGAGAWKRDRESWVWVYGFEVEERRI